MFQRRLFLSGGLAFLVANLFALGSVSAHDHAAEVYHHCQDQLELLTTNCVARNLELAEECAAEIRHLLHEGRIEEAHHLARHCIRQIEMQTRHCLHDIDELCNTCVHQLLELGSPRLANRFRHNCRRATSAVSESARHAIHIIGNAFDGF